MIIVGHARNVQGLVVVRESSRPAERIYLALGPCPCDFLCDVVGIATMCFACSGPSLYFHHTSADLE